MAERRGGTGKPRITDENIELAMALMQRRTEPRDAIEIGQVEWHQGGAAAVLSDLVVEFLKASLRPRHRHDMRALLGQRARGGIADATRGAGDESDTGSKGEGHEIAFFVM